MKYSITDLGKDITPTAINNNGQVVGYLTVANQREAITYNNGRLRYLDTFGGADSVANDINDQGHIVGTFTVNGDTHGFVLFRDGRFVDLFSVAAMVNATDINSSDMILGEITRRYDVYGTLRKVVTYDHGRINEFTKRSDANQLSKGLNNLGQAIYFKSPCSSPDCIQTYLYSKGEVTRFSWLIGEDINDREQVAGWMLYGDNYRKAIVIENGTVTPIATLGGYHSLAYSINNLGQAVGKSMKAPSTIPRDFSWTIYCPFISYQGTATELSTLLPPGIKWKLSEAVAINDRGQIIGTGLLRGEEHGFLLTPLAQPVQLDITPGDPDNKINLQPGSQLPVVLFGSPVFDAAAIKPTSLRLTAEAIGLSGRGDPYLHLIRDLNGDGYADFISVLLIDKVTVPSGPLILVLTVEAVTLDGKRVEGTVRVRHLEP